MSKSLTVYPISTGDELNVFAAHDFTGIKIMDMDGNVVHDLTGICSSQKTLNIKELPNATYIIEVMYRDEKTGRSVFVKI